MENRDEAAQRQMLNPAFQARLLDRMVTAVIGLVVALVVVGGAVVYREWKPRGRDILAFDRTGGTPIPLRSLNEAVVTRQALLLWARDCAVKAYDVDYVHWQRWVREAQPCFTNEAWRGFGVSFSANLDVIREKKMSARVVPIAHPQIAGEGVVRDTYTWRVQMPVRITWENGGGNVPEELLVDMTIVRSEDLEHPQGIAIQTFVSKPFTQRDR